jgi:hypothetical protein
MIKIAILQAAFDAIASTTPLGSVGFDEEALSGASALSGFRPTCWQSSAISEVRRLLSRRNHSAGDGPRGAVSLTRIRAPRQL